MPVIFQHRHVALGEGSAHPRRSQPERMGQLRKIVGPNDRWLIECLFAFNALNKSQAFSEDLPQLTLRHSSREAQAPDNFAKISQPIGHKTALFHRFYHYLKKNAR